MYGNQKVTWASPPPLGEPSPPPRPDEFDRVVRETLVDKLTERAHLEKRVETVHNGGQPEANESCGIAMRALWAVPLVFAAKGLKFAAKPLVGCCSVGRAPAERLTPSMPSRPTSEAPAGFPRESNGSGDAALLAAKLAGSQPSSATAAASDMLPSFNEAASQPAQAVPPTAATASPPAAAIPAASSGAVPDVQTVSTAPAAMQPGAPAQSSSSSSSMPPKTVQLEPQAGGGETSPKPKTEKKKTKGDRGSAVSVSSNVQSQVGNLLAGYAKQGGAGGRSRPAASSSAAAPSVIGAPPVAGSSAAAALSSAAAASSSSSAPATSSAAASSSAPAAGSGERPRSPPSERPRSPPGVSAAAESKSPSSGERRKKERDQSASKTVVSNFQSNSAASNLLGPMVARAGKKKAGSDAASAVG